MQLSSIQNNNLFMGIDIKKLSLHDLDLFKQLIHGFEDVFEMKNFKIPADDHLQKVLAKGRKAS